MMNIVKERRQELGYTQQQMSDLIGLKHKRAYSNFEQGIRSLQSQKILQLSKILGLEMEEIMSIKK